MQYDITILQQTLFLATLVDISHVSKVKIYYSAIKGKPSVSKK